MRHGGARWQAAAWLVGLGAVGLIAASTVGCKTPLDLGTDEDASGEAESAEASEPTARAPRVVVEGEPEPPSKPEHVPLERSVTRRRAAARVEPTPPRVAGGPRRTTPSEVPQWPVPEPTVAEPDHPEEEATPGDCAASYRRLERLTVEATRRRWADAGRPFDADAELGVLASLEDRAMATQARCLRGLNRGQAWCQAQAATLGAWNQCSLPVLPEGR